MGSLAPPPRLIAGGMLEANARLGVLRTVVGAQREGRSGGGVAQSHTIGFGNFVFSLVQLVGQSRVEACRLRGEQRRQGVVCRLADGRLEGNRANGRANAGVALIAANHRIHRVEHGDMDDGQRAAGATRAELFARRGMVDTAGIDGDVIPTTNGIEALPRALLRTGVDVGRRLIQRPERVAQAASGVACYSQA